MCRCQDGTAPQYLTAHWTPVSETASRHHLRLVANHQLTVPPHRRVIYGGRAFTVAGPSTWNSLPQRLHDPSNSASEKHSASPSTNVCSTTEALAKMHYINRRFMLCYNTLQLNSHRETNPARIYHKGQHDGYTNLEKLPNWQDLCTQ